MLELFSGIGGAAAATEGRVEVVAAVDQNPFANQTYAINFPSHPIQVLNLAGGVRLPAADLWWMSPPCQPYTVRGARRDLDDPRARSLIRLMEALDRYRPRYLALENVPLFEGSRAHALVRETLAGAGYQVQEWMLCPTLLGVPFERRRFYLVAGLGPLRPFDTHQRPLRKIQAYLDPAPAAGLEVTGSLLERYRHAFHLVEGEGARHGACFTSAYGRSPVYSGSYLREGDRLRRFSPEEILRTLHFPADYRLPEGLTAERRYGLVGNSLSVIAVREVLRAIPDLAEPQA